MLVRYGQPQVEVRQVTLRLVTEIENRTRETWRGSDGFAIGWQVYDPDTGVFISEGEWTTLEADVAPREKAPVQLELRLPDECGHYRVYVSALHPSRGWLYAAGAPLVVVDAEVTAQGPRLTRTRVTTLRRLRMANLGPALRNVSTQPFRDIWQNRGLIGSMVRREMQARYRGSFGDVLWTILHPLLLMLTYFFVFGVVLQTRFGSDPSRTGFALYFLAGMLPWLAFSEPLTRATYVILEHRNFVKKMVFPVAILPVNLTVSGLVTASLATALFLCALLVVRGGIPATAAALPLVILPHFFFTLGLCWLLATLGVFLRDLVQVMGLLLTLWFFVTPICYPESALASLPAPLLTVLGKNPMFQFVQAWRMLLLDSQMPPWTMLLKLWALSMAVFFFGYACFAYLRKTFADVV